MDIQCTQEEPFGSCLRETEAALLAAPRVLRALAALCGLAAGAPVDAALWCLIPEMRRSMIAYRTGLGRQLTAILPEVWIRRLDRALAEIVRGLAEIALASDGDLAEAVRLATQATERS